MESLDYKEGSTFKKNDDYEGYFDFCDLLKIPNLVIENKVESKQINEKRIEDSPIQKSTKHETNSVVSLNLEKETYPSCESEYESKSENLENEEIEEICIELNLDKFLVYNQIEWSGIQFWIALMKLYNEQKRKTISFSLRRMISLLKWEKSKNSYRKLEECINFFEKEIEFINYSFWFKEKDKVKNTVQKRKKKKIKSFRLKPYESSKVGNRYEIRLHPYLFTNIKSGLVVWKKINRNYPKIIQKFLYVLDTILIPYHKGVKNQILELKHIDLKKYFNEKEIISIKKYKNSFKSNKLVGSYYEILDYSFEKNNLNIKIYTRLFTMKNDYFIKKYGDLILLTEKLILCFFTNRKKNPSLERKLSKEDIKFLGSYCNKNGQARTLFLIYYISQDIEIAKIRDFGKFNLAKLFKRYENIALKTFIDHDGKEIESLNYDLIKLAMIFSDFFCERRSLREIAEKYKK